MAKKTVRHEEVRIYSTALAISAIAFLLATEVTFELDGALVVLSRLSAVAAALLFFLYHYLFAKAVAKKRRQKLHPRHVKPSFYRALLLAVVFFLSMWSGSQSSSGVENILGAIILSTVLGIVAIWFLVRSMFSYDEMLKKKK